MYELVGIDEVSDELELHERESSSESNEESLPQMSILDLAKKWMIVQAGNVCSNRVADMFFRLAVDNCEDIQRLKSENKGKIPQLIHLRRIINERLVQGIFMDFKYHDLNLPEEDREENVVHVMNVKGQPMSKYPSDKYELISQVTKVDVSSFPVRKKFSHFLNDSLLLYTFQPLTLVNIHMNISSKHTYPKKVVMSIDGVNETKSSNRSLEIVSIQFDGCREVYPCLIFRPEPNQKKSMKPEIEAYICHFLDKLLDADIHLDKVVLDAPERASFRKQKLHGGYFCCDLCLANPESISTGNGCKFLPYFSGGL